MSENTEEYENQSQKESTSIPASVTTVKEKPVCWLSTLSGICLSLIVPCFLLVIIWEGNELPDAVETILGICMGVSIVISPIIAIIAKIQIALSDGQLGGGRPANFVIIGSCIILIIAAGPAVSMPQLEISRRMMCRSNMNELVKAMRDYAQKNDGRLPEADQWCDVLITRGDADIYTFRCMASDAVYGESSYAMNINASGKKLSELPETMVLIFETNAGRTDIERTGSLKERLFFEELSKKQSYIEDRKVFKERWNQAGGPEILAKNHKNGTNVALANGIINQVYVKFPDQIKSLEDLVWNKDNLKYKASDYAAAADTAEKPKTPIMAGLVVLIAVIVIGGLAVMHTCRFRKYPVLGLVTGIGAGLAGLLFGAWAGAFYPSETSNTPYGAWGGAGLGMWIGLCYTGLLMNLQSRLHSDNILRLAIALGMAAGLLCSTLLHLGLILYCRQPYGFVFMAAGMPFGIICGVIVGAVSGAFIRKFYTQSQGDK